MSRREYHVALQARGTLALPAELRKRHHLDAALARGERPRWPKGLRVKDVEGAPGVWEMTWSFSGPDGRATWEWTTGTVDGETVPMVRWRRIGGHSIFRDS